MTDKYIILADVGNYEVYLDGRFPRLGPDSIKEAFLEASEK